MAASLACLIIPARFMRPIKNPLQPLAALQWAVHDTASRVAESLRTGAQRPISTEEYDRLAKERDELTGQVIRQGAELESLRQKVAALAGWRDRGLSSSVRPIPARVVSADAVTWRESLQLDRGSSDGVSVGDWVVSHQAGLAAGTGSTSDSGVEELAGECLLGQVAEVTPLTCRVILLSDAYLRPWVPVRIRRVAEGRLTGPDVNLLLQGVGQGRMAVRDVPARLCGGAGGIGPGDLVVSSPGDARLSISLVIGRIERIDPHPKNPQLCVLSVVPRVHTRSIREAYILSTGPREE